MFIALLETLPVMLLIVGLALAGGLILSVLARLWRLG